VSGAPLSEEQIRATLAAYLGLLQRHVSAEGMMSKILTDDFETGFVGGHMWKGLDGLRDFLSERERVGLFTPGSCAGPPASPNGASPRSSWMDSTTSTTTQSASSRPPRRG
jgi:hypothetical protein